MKSTNSGTRNIILKFTIVLGIVVLSFFIVGLFILYRQNQALHLPKCFTPIASPTERSIIDRSDDNSDYQVHVLYVLPSDVPDKQYDTNGRIAISVSAWQNWLCNQTGGKTLKFDAYQGMLDITFVRLPFSASAMEDGSRLPKNFNIEGGSKTNFIGFDLIRQIRQGGFSDKNKVYVIYYDGPNNIGGGPNAAVCGLGLLNPGYAIEFMQGNGQPNACDSQSSLAVDYTQPQTQDYATLHEILHALDIVPKCAPHVGDGNHVTDSKNDIMSSLFDAPGSTQEIAGSHIVLDFNHDDYYSANIPKCTDLKNSVFLTGGGTETPLEWQKSIPKWVTETAK